MGDKQSPTTEKTPTMAVKTQQTEKTPMPAKAAVSDKVPIPEKAPMPEKTAMPPNNQMSPGTHPVSPPTVPGSLPAYTKAAPHDLYRRLLPAVLFLLTFVTVMTMLLMYIDTTALRAQQFRVNMTHDYELLRIAQDDPSLVAYIRQLHLGAGRPRHHDTHDAPADGSPPLTGRAQLLAAATNNKYNGTFVEVAVDGARDAGTAWLQRARGWRGLVVRADPRDYLALRAAAAPSAPALHACLSPITHPKEVTYHESSRLRRHDGVSVDAPGAEGSGFSSRVLCFPLYTLLLAGRAARCDYLLLASPGARRALATVPFHAVNIQLLEVRMMGETERNSTTDFLLAHGYQVKAEVDDSVLYVRSPEAKV